MKKKLFTLLLALVAIATTAQAQNTIDGHEYVDLGLPSGTLWATCNVGATKPEAIGDHFAWGEVTPKENYTANTYRWYDNGFNKYIGSDGKLELDPEDDAATANWGKNWQMPSRDQMVELVNQCSWEWETLNGAYGRRITGPNGNSIFLPAPGWRQGTSLYDAGTGGGFWSRMRSSTFIHAAIHMQIGTNPEDWDYYSGSRTDGQVVRPVVVQSQAVEKLLLNAANFPDANFRAALASILGISEGDEITAEKIAATTELDVSSKQIADLTGIEHFTSLTYLNCWYNQLTSLDVSKNTALTELDCSYNQLTSLDVSKNTKLTILVCSRNQLTSLDVSKNTALEYLYCYNNQLTSLDVSRNTALTELECDGNQLTALDVSKNSALTNLGCVNNQLTSLDVSNNTALTYLNCGYNRLTSLDVSNNTALTKLLCHNNQLTALDVSKNTALTTLYCCANPLTALDVSKNTALTELYCYYNQLTALDVSKNTALTELRCFSNQIKGEAMDALVASLPTVESGKFYVINTKDTNEGNVCTKSQVAIAKEKGWTVYDYNYDGMNWIGSVEYEGSDDATAKLLLNAANFPDANFRTALAEILGISEGDEITEAKIAATTELDVPSKQIADLTGIEHFTALTYLNCWYNQLTALDVSKNTVLTELYCNSNQLTSLDVSKNTALEGLWFDSNRLTSLDVSKNAVLTYLHCGGNQLTSLDVSNNTALKYLDCYGNKLTSLDVSKNTLLTDLRCEGSQLTMLDISKNTALTQLYCPNNKLTALDVSKNTALTTLYCYDNQLTSLDVSGCTALTELWCYNNQLTSLDVSKYTALTRLGCHDNQLTSLNVSGCTALEYLGCSNNQLTSLDVSGCTALTDLYCNDNQLTSLDVSGCTALKTLRCDNNQLTSLDVSGCTALIGLDCSYNQLTALDVSKNTALTYLFCPDNQLTSLDVSNNIALTTLECHGNQIKGEAMDALVASLPTVSKGFFYVIDTKDENEGNVCTKSQVAIAKEKGWTVYDFNGGSHPYPEYEGSEDPVEDIDPVDEDDNVDFGSDMDENDDLNGNVIGDIYYNINTGNGGYNAAEGCIVVKKPTDDGTVNNLEGKDIFGEDFKSQFTGIVFKVPAGKGTIKVNAETTGNMLLKVKIGSNDPVEMELNGKLKVTFPYNVSETTYVYIYAGAANEAKGFGTTNDAEDAALKIYGIEFIRDETTEIDASLNDNGQRTNDSWYTLDGVKLSGEPTKKGIYIRNGKKVVK